MKTKRKMDVQYIFGLNIIPLIENDRRMKEFN